MPLPPNSRITFLATLQADHTATQPSIYNDAQFAIDTATTIELRDTEAAQSKGLIVPIAGQIEWKVLGCDDPKDARKGKSAVEVIRGVYDTSKRILRLIGIGRRGYPRTISCDQYVRC